jgi:PhnB protein
MAQDPTIVPMLSYEDVAAAIPWLERALGFLERMRMTNEDGSVGHAELTLGDGVIMLGNPGPNYQSPRHHAESCADARRWSEVPYVIDGLHVTVDDVDAHFARARDAGARILSEPHDESYGERTYRVEDLEGHRWMFAQPLRAQEWSQPSELDAAAA